MWPPAREFLDRLQHPRSRAEALTTLRARLREAPGPVDGPPEEVALALELKRLREALIEALGDVESCRTCARGHPLPWGRWTGGHCCGGRTEILFSDDEVASLRLSGTTADSVTPPSPGEDHAGCAFRGERGCSLKVADRPNVCVRYFCPTLTAELNTRGDLPHIRAIAVELESQFARFTALRAERLLEEELAGLVADTERARRG